MSNHPEFLFLKYPPINVLERFLVSIEEILGDFPIHLYINTDIRNHHVMIDTQNVVKGNQIRSNKQIEDLKHFLLNHAFIHILQIHCNVPNDQQHPGFTYEMLAGEVYDKIGINYDRGNPKNAGADFISKEIEILHKHFMFQDVRAIQKAALDRGQAEFVRIYEDNLSGLQGLTENLIQKIADQSHQWNENLMTQQRNLQDRYDGIEEKLRKEIEAERSKLVMERDSFLREKAEFDARDRTIVRRDLLKQIKGVIEDQKTASLSEATNKKRSSVDVIGYSLLILSSTAFILSFGGFWNQIRTSQTVDYLLLVPVTSSLALFVTSIVFFLRWKMSWFREHADAELQNKKFTSDILRASWIAEMYFEGKEKEDRVIPQELLASFTKDLFEPTKGPGVTHPLDDVLKVTSQFGNIKIGKDGMEINSKVK